MSKPRDRKLMMDVMKYGASVFYHDDLIAVIEVNDDKAFNFFLGDVAGMPWKHTSPLSRTWFVKTYNRKTFGIMIQVPGVSADRRDRYVEIYTSEQDYSLRNPINLARKWPSLYEAFSKVAKDLSFTPFIKDPTDDDIVRMLQNSYTNMRFLRHLSATEQQRWLKRFPQTIGMVEHSPEMAKFIIEELGGNYLTHIPLDYRTPSLCMEAVKDFGAAIRVVPEECRTEELKLVAVKRDGTALGYIKNPSVEIMLAAVKQSPDAWKYITDDKIRKKLKRMK